MSSPIVRERARRGWTAEQAASMAGVSAKTWQRFEDGKPVRDITLAKINLLFASNPIGPPETDPEAVDAETDFTGYVDRLVAEVPRISLADLRRIRDAVNTAIAIRSEVAS